MNIEAYDYDLDDRHQLLLQRIDDITSEIYSLGAIEERFAIMDRLRTLIHIKDSQNDEIASAVLGWAMEQLSLAD
jgi:hypothetical protein